MDKSPGSGKINGIAVSHGNVYMAGTVQDTTGHTYPCVWKNGVLTALPVTR